MNARNWEAVKLLNSAALTTNSSGAAVDMKAYASLAKREIKAIAFLSGLTTTTTATVKVTESATSNGTFTDPTHGTNYAVFTANGMAEFNFRNDLRYVRGEVVLNAAGTMHVNLALIAVKRFSP